MPLLECPPKPSPSLNSPTIHHLGNGLTIIAEQLPVEAVNLSLWLNVGSALEKDDINGMAHFLEHMVFKGTHRLEGGQFERLIEERGAVTNAMTSQDYTHYYITTAPQDFQALAPLQLDVVLNASIPDDAFERERLVVLEETRRALDNPRRRTYQHMVELAFDQLPYRRPVLGTESVLCQLTAQDMRDFHQTWYHPQQITAVAVGNLPVETLIETVAESAEGLLSSRPLSRPPSADSQPLALEQEPPFPQIVRRDWVDESLQQARLVMTWRVPGLAQLDKTYELDVLASLLGQGRTARLVRDLREERRLVSSITACNMTFGAQGIFYIVAHLLPENLDTVEAAIAQHIASLHDKLAQPSEIERVQIQVANRFIFGCETPSDRASLYGYHQSLIGDLTPALVYPTLIQKLDGARLQTAARNYLAPDAYGVLTIRPAS